jgi:two-component system, cell cycle sensor histidine kinase and response regulator CckA
LRVGYLTTPDSYSDTYRMTGITNDIPEEPLVLVIDDEEPVRNVIGRLLSKHGYRVLLASSGQEGIALFEQNAAAIKLVVLDWHLPGLPGEHTFDELLAREPRLRVVLVTGDHDADLGESARQYLACMLLKPFTAAELMLAVNAVLSA